MVANRQDIHSVLISGGAGFIGSHLVRHFVKKFPHIDVVCVDALTYAGNVENLADISEAKNFHFVAADVSDLATMEQVLSHYAVEGVIHLAAESHVDRSIADPFVFARSNIFGTLALLEGFRRHCETTGIAGRFHQVSTDEVYGSLALEEAPFDEHCPYSPRSPYSVSKASADHFVRSFHKTYGLDVVVSCCSNNFGPYQFPEKLIPLFIQNIIAKRPLPVYGKGENVRDWLYVTNHIEALEKVFFEGTSGETYNIGGHNEWKNIDLIKLLIKLTDQRLGRAEGSSLELITYVPDRLGHDFRYAINPTKISQELAWQPRFDFTTSLGNTIDWYLSNPSWLEAIETKSYQIKNDLYSKRFSPEKLR